MGFNDEETSRSSFVGTAEYVSPEVLHDEPVTKACDLWALGCIIYQMLVGCAPFHADSEFLTFQAIDSHIDGSKPLEQPASMGALAWDLICKLLTTSAKERIGAGDPDSGNGGEALRSHEFFTGIPWTSLPDEVAPYLPDSSKFPNPDLLRDGALPYDDWFLEGEATPLIQFAHKNEVRIEKSDIYIPIQRGSTAPSPSESQNPSGARRGLFSNSGPAMKFTSNSSSSVVLTKNVDQFLTGNEQKIYTGIVYKRKVVVIFLNYFFFERNELIQVYLLSKGLFSKRRQLVLTDAPRLIYFDPDTMELKGEIYWSSDFPISCKVVRC